MTCQRLVLRTGPALAQAADHAEDCCDFDIGAALIGLGACQSDRLLGLGRMVAGDLLGHDRDDRKDDACDQRQPPEHSVHRKDDGEVDRRPWHVEESDRSIALEKLTDRLEVTQCLAALRPRPERLQRHRLEDPVAQAFIENPADADEQPGPDKFEEPIKSVEYHRQNRQSEERRHAAAGQDAVIDLQHEQWPGQHQ